MATVIVTRNGKPVPDALVTANTTGNFRQHDRSGRTDSSGEAELQDGVNRYYVSVNGKCVETVGKLVGTIRVSL